MSTAEEARRRREEETAAPLHCLWEEERKEKVPHTAPPHRAAPPNAKYARGAPELNLSYLPMRRGAAHSPSLPSLFRFPHWIVFYEDSRNASPLSLLNAQKCGRESKTAT